MANESVPKTSAAVHDLRMGNASGPSEYALLNRALDRADEEETAFIREVLVQWAEAPLTPQEAALGVASHHFKLGIPVESIDETYTRIVMAVMLTSLQNRWLYRFLSKISMAVVDRKEKLSPDEVMEMLGQLMSEFHDNLDLACEILSEYPECLAGDILKAATVLEAKSNAR